MQEATLESSHAPATWRRWFAFLGGGSAWTFHLLSIYAIGEFGCVGGWDRPSYAGITVVAWMLMLFSGLALVPAAAAAFVAYQDQRRDARRQQAVREDEGGRYLSRFGLILNALFIFIIFVESMPVFAYLYGCNPH